MVCLIREYIYKKLLKNDEDVGMKNAQKQDIIHNGRIHVFGFLYPFLHST